MRGASRYMAHGIGLSMIYGSCPLRTVPTPQIQELLRHRHVPVRF